MLLLDYSQQRLGGLQDNLVSNLTTIVVEPVKFLPWMMWRIYLYYEQLFADHLEMCKNGVMKGIDKKCFIALFSTRDYENDLKQLYL